MPAASGTCRQEIASSSNSRHRKRSFPKIGSSTWCQVLSAVLAKQAVLAEQAVLAAQVRVPLAAQVRAPLAVQVRVPQAAQVLRVPQAARELQAAQVQVARAVRLTPSGRLTADPDCRVLVAQVSQERQVRERVVSELPLRRRPHLRLVFRSWTLMLGKTPGKRLLLPMPPLRRHQLPRPPRPHRWCHPHL